MKSNNIFQKTILSVIGIGIWVLVLQNAGIIPTEKKVHVNGGNIDVSGSVNVDNTVGVSGGVFVSGGYIEVGNTVDINIDEINGHRDVFFNNPSRGDRSKYYVLPVTVE